MSTNIENGIKLPHSSQKRGELLGVLPHALAVLEELDGYGVRFEGLDGGGVEGCSASGWGSNCYFGVGCEDFVGMGKFGLFGRRGNVSQLSWYERRGMRRARDTILLACLCFLFCRGT
jgi:hypothetical protein